MKRILPLMLIFVIPLAGCSKAVREFANVLNTSALNAKANSISEEDEDSFDAVKLSRDTKYYNDYLGISYTVPKGWWCYDVDESNLSESRGETGDSILLDVDYGDFKNYSYSKIWLMSFGSLEKSTSDNHLGFSFVARSLNGINNISGFMKYYELYMLEPTDNEEYTLLESEQLNIKGKLFELRDYLVTREKDNFNIITLSCEVKNGYFLNIMVDYWPENKNAKRAIIESVTKGIEFYI